MAIEVEQIVAGAGVGGMFIYRIGGRPITGQPTLVRDNAPAVGSKPRIDEESAGLAFGGHRYFVPLTAGVQTRSGKPGLE
jgi:hypothetical protein